VTEERISLIKERRQKELVEQFAKYVEACLQHVIYVLNWRNDGKWRFSEGALIDSIKSVMNELKEWSVLEVDPQEEEEEEIPQKKQKADDVVEDADSAEKEWTVLEVDPQEDAKIQQKKTDDIPDEYSVAEGGATKKTKAS